MWFFFTFYNFKKRIIVKNIILIVSKNGIQIQKRWFCSSIAPVLYIKPNIKEAEKSMFLSLLSYGTK